MTIANNRFVKSIFLLFLLVGVEIESSQAQSMMSATAPSGVTVSGASIWPAMSRDGAYVSFITGASDLMSGDTNGVADVIRYNLGSNSYTWGTRSGFSSLADGWSSAAELSSDGNYVVYSSTATNLNIADSDSTLDIYFKNLDTDTNPSDAIELISISTGGTKSNAMSDAPSISQDGNRVVFESLATNLVAGVTDGVWQVYMRDRSGNTTTVVSKSSAGVVANAASSAPSISKDGTKVVFSSVASNLVDNDTNGQSDIFLHDLNTNTTTRVSAASDGSQFSTASSFGVISGDGNYVAFVKQDAVSGYKDIFLKNLATGELRQVSNGLNNAATDNDSGDNFEDLFVSDTGSYVVYSSEATNLVANDTNGQADIFVWDSVKLTTTRVNLAANGDQADGSSSHPMISTDGRYITFASNATNLITGDTNSLSDIFIVDMNGDGDGDGYVGTYDCAPYNASQWNYLYADADGDGYRDTATYEEGICAGATAPAGYVLSSAGGDNCVGTYNPDQADYDGDIVGDACDLDDDNDGYNDAIETAYGTNPLDASSYVGRLSGTIYAKYEVDWGKYSYLELTSVGSETVTNIRATVRAFDSNNQYINTMSVPIRDYHTGSVVSSMSPGKSIKVSLPFQLNPADLTGAAVGVLRVTYSSSSAKKLAGRVMTYRRDEGWESKNAVDYTYGFALARELRPSLRGVKYAEADLTRTTDRKSAEGIIDIVNTHSSAQRFRIKVYSSSGSLLKTFTTASVNARSPWRRSLRDVYSGVGARRYLISIQPLGSGPYLASFTREVKLASGYSLYAAYTDFRAGAYDSQFVGVNSYSNSTSPCWRSSGTVLDITNVGTNATTAYVVIPQGSGASPAALSQTTASIPAKGVLSIPLSNAVFSSGKVTYANVQSNSTEPLIVQFRNELIDCSTRAVETGFINAGQYGLATTQYLMFDKTTENSSALNRAIVSNTSYSPITIQIRTKNRSGAWVNSTKTINAYQSLSLSNTRLYGSTQSTYGAVRFRITSGPTNSLLVQPYRLHQRGEIADLMIPTEVH